MTTRQSKTVCKLLGFKLAQFKVSTPCAGCLDVEVRFNRRVRAHTVSAIKPAWLQPYSAIMAVPSRTRHKLMQKDLNVPILDPDYYSAQM